MTNDEATGSEGKSPRSKRRRRSSKYAQEGRVSPEQRESTLTRGHYVNILLGVVLVCGFVVFSATIIGKTKSQTKSPTPPPAAATIEKAPSESKQGDGNAEPIATSLREWEAALDAAGDIRRLIDLGNFAQARERAERALEATPELVDLEFLYAQVLYRLGEFDKARDNLVDLLSHDPNYAEARVILARVFVGQQQFEEALTVGRWMLTSEPYNDEAHQIVATSFMNTGHPAQAIPHLRHIVEQDASNVLAQNDLAKAMSAVGDYTKATQLLERSLEENATVSISHYNLAVCYADQARVEDAVNVLTKAAGSFGNTFVQAWIQSRDFDAIRDEEPFVKFVGNLLALSSDKPMSTSISALSSDKLETASE